jgi:peptidyl-prolyl cis-trans isomerase A (cyclophilin A)/peptidyl-prolyl cis-trans isomerase B (cyclophilin B)
MARFLAVIGLLASLNAGAANPQVELKTSLGAIVVELDADKAPLTVENFLQYVKNGHYDGTVFHRVIPGFMIQSGGFTADFKEKPTRASIRNEAGNGLRNAVGTLAMARTSDPHSASAQFFINVADNTSLNFRFPTQEGYGYAVFGKVVKGMDVVERIVRVQTGPGPASHQNVPVKPVVIEHARLIVPPDKQEKAKQ